jgi:hypothetical protein
MIDLNDALALTLFALFWLAGSLALRRSLRDSGSTPSLADHSCPGSRRAELRNHTVGAWPRR